MNKHHLLSCAKFKKIRGIEAVVFGLVLLFLPVNLAKHFFFDFAYVDGILVDYLIPTIYLTDILIWGLLGLWLFRCLRSFSTNHLTIQPFSNFSILSFGLLLVSGLSIFGALNQPAAFYKWLKLTEYILFSFYVSKNVRLKGDWLTIVRLLSVGVLFESILAIAQWFKQGSIFGYYFFGENKYTVSTPGIATFDFGGVKKVRPYGTFPHPNVLGGYLSIVLPWVLHNLSSKFKIQSSKFSLSSVLYLLPSILGLVALYLSFSRSAWLAGTFGLLLTLTLILRTGFTFSLLPPLPSLLTTLSYIRRAELNWIALQITKDHPLLGVGLNNFTIAMDKYGKISGWVRFLQPAHNVYLLIASEIGLLGLALFLCLLFSAFRLLLRKKNYLLLISLTQIALLCLSDHYFWTLQQTCLFFWLLIGLVFTAEDDV